MKRPVCVCCTAMLAVQLTAALLPQVAFWVPAAFLLCLGLAAAARRARAAGCCLVIAALLGLTVCGATLLFRKLPAERWNGRSATVVARVEQAEPSYMDGAVSAVLRITQINGARTNLLCTSACMPECEPGDVIGGRFLFSSLSGDDRRLSSYADGIFCEAEYESGFSVSAHGQGLQAAFYRLRLRLSGNIRRYLPLEEGDILAAMTVGDRRFLSAAVNRTYRAAGIPHVLVISGLHLSLICGLIPLHWERRRSRLLHAAGSLAAALLLMGVTGGTPSVMRAGLAVIIGSVGAMLDQPPDPVTSLAVSGAILSLPNAYAVCDVAFALSFAATAGVLAGAGWMRGFARRHPPETLPVQLGQELLSGLVTAAAASVFTLPILVLYGMNVSVVSVLTNMAVLWLVSPILVCGLIVAVGEFVPLLHGLLLAVALIGGLLVRLMSLLAGWFASIPGAQFHPETPYAVLVLAILAGFCALAFRLRLPRGKTACCAAALLCFAAALSLGLSRGLICVSLVGNAYNPAVVITQDGHAAVLFRGGAYNVQKIGTYLEDRGMDGIDLLIDLRMEPSGACPLEAAETCLLSEMEPGQAHSHFLNDLKISVYTHTGGGAVMLRCGSDEIVTCTGTRSTEQAGGAVRLLLGAAGNPGRFSQAETALCLSRNYAWLDSAAIDAVYYGSSGLSVWLRPGAAQRRWPARITGGKP